jgi:diguanylate cyclase (GGDEF)-like protein/PAS domain S-box-containing protein
VIPELPETVVVLALQGDDERHARLVRALRAVPSPRYEIHRVTSLNSARAALAEHAHDVCVVEHLANATEVLERDGYAPVVLIASRDDADRATDLAAAAAGVTEYLVDPEPAELERALRYAISHRSALRALAESEERHALALQGANDGLWDWDVRADRLYCSPRWKAMLGYEPDEIGDAPVEWLGRVHPDDRVALSQALDAHLAGDSRHFEHEYRIEHRDGSWRWMLGRGVVVRDRFGRAARVVGSQSDVTDRKLAEERLQQDAMHDSLTGLPNRVLFIDRLDQAIRRAQRRRTGACAAVLFLDLDRFKVVNDSLGHLAGDQLLVAVGRRLEDTLRPTDTVARLGGDEFTLLLSDVSGADEAIAVAERVRRSLAAPFELGGRALFVNASVGIALARPDAAPEDVVRDADVAMYRAKAEGTGGHAVFDAEMHAQMLRRLDLEDGLRRALEAGTLQVAYQPFVQAATGRIAGFEALCRWPDGQGGFHDPADFLPIAEETGLVVALGAWVLQAACAQLAEWREEACGAGLTMGVNVSRRQLLDPAFGDVLADALASAGLDPAALRLEVSEVELSHDPDRLRATLAGLYETHGVASHIDDFGMGASSLRLLQGFPGDAVKIHRGLVMGMGRDAGAFEMVKALAGLAHNLGLEVIAEGVEREEQLEYLRVLGCEFAQGFHLAAPLAPSGAAALLRDGVLNAAAY